jgi:hypothetical protein
MLRIVKWLAEGITTDGHRYTRMKFIAFQGTFEQVSSP